MITYCHHLKRAAAALCLATAGTACVSYATLRTAPRAVTLRFIDSPYADYLFYLLYRDTTRLPAIRAVRLDSVPTVDELIALPEIVASAPVSTYEDILPYVELYRSPEGRIARTPVPRVLTYSQFPAYDSLRSIVVRGASMYPAFLALWHHDVEPVEQRTIAVWRDQAAACHPMDSLQVMERLRFPSDSLVVAAIYFHLAGSNNYSPMGVYSRLFDNPNLGVVLGHEATHLMVNPVNGTNWQKHPRAARAIALASAAGLTASDLEEMLPLLMQVKLGQACGLTPATRRISDKFKSDTVRYRILTALEDAWPAYRADRAKWPTVIDYFLDRSTLALESRSTNGIGGAK